MYLLYEEQVREDKNRTAVSKYIYNQQFQLMNLSFKSPRSDTCNTCDQLHMKIKSCDNEEMKTTLQSELKAHQDDAELAYEQKRNDKADAASSTAKKCLAFDLQQVLPTPLLNCNTAFYKRKLLTYNLTIRDTSSKEV